MGLGPMHCSTSHWVSVSSDGTFAVVADRMNHGVRHIVITTASVTTLAGGYGFSDGVGTNALFYGTFGVALSPDGKYALVVDSYNHKIRKVIISTGEVTTLAGNQGFSNGIGTNARFDRPIGVCISPNASYALVVEESNHMVRMVII
jgi:DNA-binding beta-propeller fold protein YncE